MKAREWREAVAARDRYACAAHEHDPRCTGWFEEAHHIVYKSQLPTSAYWIVENGIGLSRHCHQRAHQTHNANIAQDRLTRAVESVRPLVTKWTVPHFARKPLGPP